jgi:hypothetical protein
MYVFAAALPPIGLSHLLYADATAQLVPSWLPLRHGWAYVTGAGHVAAGVAIVLGIVPRPEPLQLDGALRLGGTECLRRDRCPVDWCPGHQRARFCRIALAAARLRVGAAA